MSRISTSLSLFLSFAALLRAQSSPASPADAHAGSAHQLDKFIVSTGSDPKTSFDLAQGTSVLIGDELRRLAQGTLGETLASLPGVAATSYGPGASRPVIRGLAGDRIRVLGNGIGALDASSVSPDHKVALEPLFASRIEVLRGPTTLLYGSSAVGGVVNVFDHTIPETAPDGRVTGSAEFRAGGAAEERTGVVSAGGGTSKVAFHLNALHRTTEDLRIAGVARIDPDAPADQAYGRLPNSATRTYHVSTGASLFGPAGHAGAGLSHFQSTYGVPTGDDPPIRIEMRQTRLELAGETAQLSGPFRSARLRVGLGDYWHAERDGDGHTHAVYTNRAMEGRLELPHVPLGNLSGTVGLQGARSDFAATGDEVATPPSVTQSAAVFVVEELKFHDRASLQFGTRFEGQSIRLGEVATDLPTLPGYTATTGQRRRHGGVSGSVGLVYHPLPDWSVGTSLAYTERLPTTQELFSNGPHGGTGTYEVGTPGLDRERSVGFEVTLRRRVGFVTGSVGAFVNQFADYIFEEALPENAIPDEYNPEHLKPYRFVARDARFRGAEAEVVLHLIDTPSRQLHLAATSDFVRADEITTDHPMPRIPPWRYGARLAYREGPWSAGFSVHRAHRQTRVAAGETSTGGSTLIDADLSRVIINGPSSCELFLRGRNLTNASAREHTSFLKEFAPSAGRGVLGGIRVSF